MVKSRHLAVIGVVLLAVSACGGDGPGSDGSVSISVELSETAITLSQQSVETGQVELAVSNAGTIVHEIEVFSGSKTDLPVDKGVADTTGLVLVDEIEDIIPGANIALDLDLETGEYVIICNLPGHYQMGMVTKLTVTG